MLDWKSTQATLFSLVHGDIEEFVPRHRDEQFYGFFLDCNAYYGDVFPNLNTPALLRSRAEIYKHDLQRIAGPGISRNLYATRTVEQIEEELRWSPGDWGYLQVNRWEQWRKDWEPIRKIVENVRSDNDSFESQFMDMVCRLLIKIEESGVLDLLPQTADFVATCADHEEPLDEARDRLKRIREQPTS